MRTKLEEMSWLEVAEALEEDPVILFPMGSTEQHGPHNPLGADWLVPRAIADRVAERSPNVLVLPTLPFGYADYHLDFPGTISLREETLYQVILDVAESLVAHGARHFLFLDGHGGNFHSCTRVAHELRKQGALAATLLWWDVIGALDEEHSPAGHGDWVETSIVMAAAPGLVRLELASAPPHRDLSEELRLLTPNELEFEGAVVHVSLRTSDFSEKGDMYEPELTPKADLSIPPEAADQAVGERLLELVADYTVRFVEAFRKVRIEPLPPGGVRPATWRPQARWGEAR